MKLMNNNINIFYTSAFSFDIQICRRVFAPHEDVPIVTIHKRNRMFRLVYSSHQWNNSRIHM